MSNSLQAAAERGLQRSHANVAGRFTPPTHRSYSEAGSWVAGVRRVPIIGKLFSSGPGSGDGVLDKLTLALAGGRLEPSSLLGYPPSTPADWTAQLGPTADVKYASYVEGVDAGFVRGFLVSGVLAGIGIEICRVLSRKKG